MRAVCAASDEGALPAVVSHGAKLRTAPVDTRADCVRADSQISKNKQNHRQGWPMSGHDDTTLGPARADPRAELTGRRQT